MRTEKFYNSRLQAYFDAHYLKHIDTAEWYTNPAINQWKCDIPELQVTILFTCDDKGNA